jgi:hypothetical protein
MKNVLRAVDSQATAAKRTVQLGKILLVTDIAAPKSKLLLGQITPAAANPNSVQN